ncbi:acyl carrier protein [Burkholderia pseudomallei]|nr:acyl carrier protein [Burkholderia pseudomallei]
MSTLQQENVEERVKQIVAEQFCMTSGEIRNDAKLAEDLGADSLDAIELVMAVEDEFGIEISDEQAEKLQTVQQVIDHVQSR